MGQVQRRIGSLRLRAPSQSLARRAALGIEDALRTSSLPDADGGRLWLVRRLCLGRLPMDLGPAGLSRRLELAFLAARSSCVHALSGDAAHAGGVWFHSSLEAHVWLALRLLEGPPPVEWFWSRAVPAGPGGWGGRGAASSPQAAALGAVLGSLCARPEAASAVPAWCTALASRGHVARTRDAIDALGATLPPALRAAARRALQAAAGSVHMAVASDTAETGSGARDPSGIATAAGRVAAHLVSGGDAPPLRRRRRADPACAQPSGRRRATDPVARPPHSIDDVLSGATDATSPALPRAPVAKLERSGATGALEPRSCEHTPTTAGPPSLQAGRQSAPMSPSVRRTGHGTSPEVSHRTPNQPGTTPSAVPEQTVPPATAGQMAEGMASAAAGLAFLLPVLARLGYAQWLDASPAWAGQGVLQRVFGQALDRLGVDPADPARILAQATPASRAPPARFVAPASWRDCLMRGTGPLRCASASTHVVLLDPSGRLLLAAWRGVRPRALLADIRGACPADAAPAFSAEQVALAWLHAARRWLRRQAGIGLHDLVCRSGRIACGYTHLDVTFALGDVDLRVRRAGLDFDPGWLPWLGRVVGFHFLPGGRP